MGEARRRRWDGRSASEPSCTPARSGARTAQFNYRSHLDDVAAALRSSSNERSPHAPTPLHGGEAGARSPQGRMRRRYWGTACSRSTTAARGVAAAELENHYPAWTPSRFSPTMYPFLAAISPLFSLFFPHSRSYPAQQILGRRAVVRKNLILPP